MAGRQKIPFLAGEHLHRTTAADEINGKGTGVPYDTVAGTGYKGPVVSSGYGGWMTIIQDIQVPATNINNNVNWTSGGVYGGLANANRLPVFNYFASALSELNGRSNFFLQDVQFFFGSTITGAAAPGGTTAVVDVQIATAPNDLVAWSIGDAALSSSVGRLVGAMNETAHTYASSRILGGENYGEDYFYLTMRCDATSPVNLTAGRIRLVMVGYEF